jgi:hypothetical protein
MDTQQAALRPYKVTHSLADSRELDALLGDVFGDAWGDPVVVFNSGTKFGFKSCTCDYIVLYPGSSFGGELADAFASAGAKDVRVEECPTQPVK